MWNKTKPSHSNLYISSSSTAAAAQRFPQNRRLETDLLLALALLFPSEAQGANSTLLPQGRGSSAAVNPQASLLPLSSALQSVSRHILQPCRLQQPHFADSRTSEQGNQSQGQCPNYSAPLSLLTKELIPGTKVCSLLCATQDALSKDEKNQERTLEDKQEQRPDALAETFQLLRRLRGRGEKSRH